jgi:AmiR/NasT family two-component response regulator
MLRVFFALFALIFVGCGNSNKVDIDGKKVLYIGRNLSDREIAETLMSDTGIAHQSVGRLADIAVNVSSADMVFLDSGTYEVEEWERVIHDCIKLVGNSNISIVAVIPHLDAHHLETAKNLGISSFLFKPLDPEKFYRTLLDHLVPAG